MGSNGIKLFSLKFLTYFQIKNNTEKRNSPVYGIL